MYFCKGGYYIYNYIEIKIKIKFQFTDMIYAGSVFRICYLLFLYQVLQDLQETLEFEIFGPSRSVESKNTEDNEIESKTHTSTIS